MREKIQIINDADKNSILINALAAILLVFMVIVRVRD